MGYQLPERTLTLKFQGTDFDGAEVITYRSVTLDAVLRIQDAAAEQNLPELFDLVGEHVIKSWNLEDVEGHPIPATPDGIRQVSADFINVVVQHWSEAVGNVPGPLADGSSNGSTLEVLSTEMESLTTPSPQSPSNTGS